jgi:CheY-like chemotaxis protein
MALSPHHHAKPDSPPPAQPLVLCIDDEMIGLRVRRILLERAGYRVLSAHEGEEGIDIFAREPVQAVVLDYAMPGLNGAEVATRLRKIKPKVPILLLSAYMGLPKEVTCLVDVYMTKGEGAPMLLKKLSTMIPAPVSHESADLLP